MKPSILSNYCTLMVNKIYVTTVTIINLLFKNKFVNNIKMFFSIFVFDTTTIETSKVDITPNDYVTVRQLYDMNNNIYNYDIIDDFEIVGFSSNVFDDVKKIDIIVGGCPIYTIQSPFYNVKISENKFKININFETVFNGLKFIKPLYSEIKFTIDSTVDHEIYITGSFIKKPMLRKELLHNNNRTSLIYDNLFNDFVADNKQIRFEFGDSVKYDYVDSITFHNLKNVDNIKFYYGNTLATSIDGFDLQSVNNKITLDKLPNNLFMMKVIVEINLLKVNYENIKMWIKRKNQIVFMSGVCGLKYNHEDLFVKMINNGPDDFELVDLSINDSINDES